MDTLKKWVTIHYASYGFTSPSAALENCFLHAKRKVIVNFAMGGSDTIPAYNPANPRLSRLPSTWEKNSDWCMNVKSSVYRSFWFTYWEPVGATGYDGYMLDVYSFPNDQSSDTSTIEFVNDSDYQASLVGFTQTLRQTMQTLVPPKVLGINSYLFGGTDTFQFVNYFDFELREMGLSYAYGYSSWSGPTINATYTACGQGKMILFQHDQQFSPDQDASLTKSQALDRDRITGLCAYFMAKNGPTYFFSYPGQWYGYDKRVKSWFDAMAYDIGQPVGKFYTFAQGNDPASPGSTKHYIILARQYDKALVLFKPAYDWNTSIYDSRSSTTHSLGAAYRPLNADGTLGGVISSISLKNWDGAILISQNASILNDAKAFGGPRVYPIQSMRKDPVIRIAIGNITFLKISIYNAAGKLVDSQFLPTPIPSGVNSGGKSYFDFTCKKATSSGIYNAVIHAATSGGKEIKLHCRFTVTK
jgi:hypothetical protein